ncbi:response regulator CheB (receptor modification enzyme, protein-glutamate methylesterase) [Catenovulum agarivorans DS-2]|uniref:Response regulator CheB (Receptor modification enzyme, protein-glutamate methylesterase) n=1 Tax=Catenovulum agarivorans DS-2 TaxID=1328313 RepID=W7Q973_9ALTE|nr:two-component system response regulator [Catenovulum agarivorans]EWH09349.1 response regulator CheB (receptor modification enzyme, protein-glutamate methylesterase) [Catenovulum agarivorans DS-2]
MNYIPDATPSILIVDDEPTNLRVLKGILQQDYQLTFAKSGEDALKIVADNKPNLILLDIMMPNMSGYDVCRKLKADDSTASVPVIFVSALNDELDEALGFELGAVDYITKPVSPALVKARVKNHLSLVQADELKRTRMQVIQVLGRAAEYKDNETGMHVIRMSHYAKILAKAIGLSDVHAEKIMNAAPMHDIGKIGIADNILQKPGRLTDEEMDEMRKHPEIGAEILGECDSPLLRLARSIALTHHEKWDGSGYPRGLAGENIPLEGRIVALADVFDALTSERPYKKAWSIEKTLDFVQSQSGVHFDPKLVTALLQHLPEFLAIKEKWQET